MRSLGMRAYLSAVSLFMFFSPCEIPRLAAAQTFGRLAAPSASHHPLAGSPSFG